VLQVVFLVFKKVSRKSFLKKCRVVQGDPPVVVELEAGPDDADEDHEAGGHDGVAQVVEDSLYNVAPNIF